MARDVGALIFSGLFQHNGMIVERRKLLLATRETHYQIYIWIICRIYQKWEQLYTSPVPAFYTKPKTIGDIIEQISGRILSCFGIDANNFPGWDDVKNTKTLL